MRAYRGLSSALRVRAGDFDGSGYIPRKYKRFRESETRRHVPTPGIRANFGRCCFDKTKKFTASEQILGVARAHAHLPTLHSNVDDASGATVCEREMLQRCGAESAAKVAVEVQLRLAQKCSDLIVGVLRVDSRGP